MKTKRTVGKTVVAIIAIIALAIGVLPLTMGKTGSASADVTPNKTAVLNTSSMTRITAATDFVPLGDRQETPGHNVSVELDVVSSELKNAANADYIKEWLPSPIAQNKDIYQFPMSGVSFNFWRYSAELGDTDPWMWHGPIQGDTNPSNGSWALLYLADGRILLTAYRNADDGSTRKLWEVVKWDGDQLAWNADAFDWVNGTYIEGTAPRGSIDEVKNFLNPGYSYKVTLHEGFVTEDLQVTDQKMGAGYDFLNPWYVVYKKAIGTDDWTVSFAIPLNRNGVAGNAIEGHCYSGFEIMGNGIYRKTTAADGDFNNVGCSNITMELDNISIYADWSDTKNTITFDDATAEFELAEADSTVTSAGTVYFSGAGYWAGVGGAGQGDKYNSMTYTQHGITINSINAPIECVRTPATRTLNTYADVSALEAAYSEATTKVALTAAYTADSLAALQTAINGVDMPALRASLIENQAAVDAAALSLTNAINALVLNQFTVTFKVDNEVYDTVTVDYGATAALSKATPTKDGYTFDGWDGSLSNITADKIINAQFTINTYTVTFEMDGGTLSNSSQNNITTLTVDYGTAASVLDTYTKAKTGYTFTKWQYLDGNNYVDLPANATVTENVTLKAVWTINTYTVTFKVDGEVYDTVTVNYGATAALSKDEPTKNGYTFNGWDGSLENITADKTVNAQFEKKAGCGSAIDGSTFVAVTALALALCVVFIVVKARRKED